ncbi:helix-turn-helix transcriptional regulator (plasmid) [Embleya sp. NBC_00888]|nr:helix-turn-helix transcriptional regulator [Embleya sp. NBC_00888]
MRADNRTRRVHTVEDLRVRSGGDRPPREYELPGSGTWPDVQLVPDAPVSAHYGREVARRLHTILRDRHLKETSVAARAGLSHPTLGRILAGTTSVTVATLARLEMELETDLYPVGLYKEVRTAAVESPLGGSAA